jgi:asparagine synthase (glutamine-hydrolysing)
VASLRVLVHVLAHEVSMCGVTALLGLGADVDVTALEKMTRVVAHRGPDGQGTVLLSALEGGDTLQAHANARTARVGLGHRRLSILDLSDAGHQPMVRGDWWISYNGEVFNYLEVRAELQALGHRFVSECDTEVILAAVQQWGAQAFARLRGMWGLIMVNAHC